MITLVPDETPETKPVLLTVAFPVVAETQGLADDAVPVPLSWVVDPTQTVNVPETVGSGLTVTVAVTVQPLLSVYVITLVPVATPVTKPALLTVALVVVPETLGVDVAAVPLAINCVVEPIQTLNVPLIVGNGLTVIMIVCSSLQVPFLTPSVYVPLIDGFD